MVLLTLVGLRKPVASVEPESSGTSSNPIRFFGEIVSELRKVNWPNRQEAWRLTTLVIVIAIVIGAALGLIDMGFSRVFAIVAGN